MAQFLLQMAGWMGSGKSTVAAAVRSSTGAVVLDHDTTKSAVLSAGVPHPPAGAVSYEVVFDLVRDLLAQEHSVIIDSPAAYAAVPARGMALASAAGTGYYFVECVCPANIAAERVNGRDRRPSQVTGAEHAAEVRASSSRRPHRPGEGALTLDTTEPLADCVDAVLAYLATTGAAGPVVSSPVAFAP